MNLTPLLALLGIPVGLLLGYVAIEELDAGKKFFLVMKKFLFVFLSLISLYYLYLFTLALAIFLFIVVTLFFILEIKRYRLYLEFIVYIIFLTPLFLLPNQLYILLTTTLLFLYGFPIGSILYHERQKKQKRS